MIEEEDYSLRGGGDGGEGGITKEKEKTFDDEEHVYLSWLWCFHEFIMSKHQIIHFKYEKFIPIMSQ